MSRRLGLALALVLATAGCSSDPIVGRWGGANARDRVLVLHEDGRLDLPINSIDPTCEDATTVIAACERRQRWERRRGRYRLALAAVGRTPRVSGFEPTAPCTCALEHHEVELHGDELAVTGTAERLRRLR